MWAEQRYMTGLLCCLVCTGAGAEGFLEDSRTSLRYSQSYWKENDGGGFGPTRDEWVQATQFSFSSGWYRDVLGIDYSYGLADALHVGREANSISNLRADRSVQQPHGIAKPLELYLRGRWVDENGTLSGGVGKKSRQYELYRDDRYSRILPAATLGQDLGYEYGALSLNLSRIDGFSPRNESGWSQDLRNHQGRTIEDLRLYALGYVLPDGSRLQLEHGVARDYLRSSSVKLAHGFELAPGRGIDIHAIWGRQQDAGKRFEYGGVRGLYEAESSHDARHLDLSFKYRFSRYYTGLTWNKVWGDDFDRTFFAQDHGTWNSSGKLFYYFGLENEEMVKLLGGMDFADVGLPRLKLDLHYAFSDHARGYQGFSRREFQSVLQYQFDGALKGLDLAWLHGRFRTQGEPDGVQRQSISRGPAGIISHSAERFYLNYTYRF
ncbi:OprD family outer membrane porin [Pseudomonas sp. Fl4BN1]|uniref:OprD family outer membrane porin n=1 Tax=Pseudomonas sp. Fl4BN1 TaxID=2697651 RepID=UPI00137838DB|nr:OprD family outer membrane porin [Pseudomonas sp. Fl4BN1]NBF12767.1 outer membrane porin, OprD family [Pseudomonas sp. Fl4BN1]